MHKVGVIHGRFQILHKDHLVYLLAGKKRCSHLVIGITNPDPKLTKEDTADPERSNDMANPLTYYERYQLVRIGMREQGISDDEFSIVPFPVNIPRLYRYYVPMDAVFFLTIYDSWGEKKLQMFKEMGLQIEVLWRRTPATKGLSASEVRKRMAEGEAWRQFVSPAVAAKLEELEIPDRLRKANLSSWEEGI